MQSGVLGAWLGGSFLVACAAAGSVGRARPSFLAGALACITALTLMLASRAAGACDYGALPLHQTDPNDEQEAIDFTFRIRAVDLAGNEGPPKDVRIRHGGSSGGCRMASRGVDLSWGVLCVMLWVLRRDTHTRRLDPRLPLKLW